MRLTRRGLGWVAVVSLLSVSCGRPGASEQAADRGPTRDSIRVGNLTTLGKVWGFAKYHHPRVASGELDWDQELLGILPSVSRRPRHRARRDERVDRGRRADRALRSVRGRARLGRACRACRLDSRRRRARQQALGSARAPPREPLAEFVPAFIASSDARAYTLGPSTGLEVGDVIVAVDDVPVETLTREWAPYYAASNRPTRLRDIALELLRGETATVDLTIERDGRVLEVTAPRVGLGELDRNLDRVRDLPGPAFRLLSPEVAYLKLSAVSAASATEYVEQARGTEVFVIDIRNYPSDFVVFALGRHLVDEPTPFARFTRATAANPGVFTMGEPIHLEPRAPFYRGRLVILVDEVSQSQAEYTAMAFRTAPGALVVGSTTAGADGNVSPVPLPGGLRTVISGIGVFYPDGSPTQRVGILPDLVATPTIAGIREGRDEVLEAAVSAALGREFRLEG